MTRADAVFRQTAQQTGDGAVQQGIERDGDDGSGNDGIGGFRGKDAVACAQRGQNKGKFSDLGQCRSHAQRLTQRTAQQKDDSKRSQRLAEQYQCCGDQNQRPYFRQSAGIEQHAHGDEKQYGKGVAQRQGFGGRPRAEVGLAYHHARQKSSEGHGRTEEFRRTHGNAQRQSQHGQSEQIPRARSRHKAEQPGDELLPHDQGKGHQRRKLERGNAQSGP